MPIPALPNGGQSALEVAAINQRNILLPKNYYNNASKANNYSAQHTRALADQTTPYQGKGTGVFLDIYNYNGGSAWDIYGNQGTAIGSGRIPAFALNRSTWGYDFVPTNWYKQPDTSKNIGQVIIG